MPLNDHVFVDDIEVACRIGTTQEERAFPQLIWISLKAYLSLKPAGTTDDLKHSVDYAQIVDMVRNAVTENIFNLVEAVAERAASEVLKNQLVEAVSVRVEKRIIPGTRAVGAEIFRSREGA